MPTARELLEQADALMRRNRGRETLSPSLGPRTMAPTIARRVAPGDFPVLTDTMDAPPPAVAPTPEARGARVYPAPDALPAGIEPASARPPAADAAPPEARFADAQPVPAPASHAPEPLRTDRVEPTLAPYEAPAETAAPPAPEPSPIAFADVPVLTDAIAEIDAALLAATEEGEPSIWNDEAMRGDDSVLGPAPKSIAAIPESHAIADPPRGSAVEADAARVAAATDELIDEVRMQVLQRIDMFTDTGLREQLGERLRPIVERASDELVATINQRVGELLRGYVAEAIERELERLRKEIR